MNTALWIVQWVLALVFFAAGMMKLTEPREKIIAKMPFAEDFSLNILRLIGLLEVLGAAGLLVPMLARVFPMLMLWAGMGLMLIMVGAMVTHIRRKEYPNLIINIILFTMAGFVTWGRWAP